MAKLFGQNPPADLFPIYSTRVHALIWDYVDRVLGAGTDVILDFGFWARLARDEARARVQRHGALAQMYSFDCAVPEAKRRVMRRNQELPPDCLYIDEAAFDLFASKFEALGEDESSILVPSGPSKDRRMR